MNRTVAYIRRKATDDVDVYFPIFTKKMYCQENVAFASADDIPPLKNPEINEGSSRVSMDSEKKPSYIDIFI